MYLNLYALVAFYFAGLCLAAPSTDDQCTNIGGVCKDVYTDCNGDLTFYTGLCAPPSDRLCCAPKMDDTDCKSRGGWCDYNCEGSMPVSGLCGGQLSCCIALQ